MKDADLEHLDNELIKQIDAHYASQTEEPRLYLGGSEIGHWCPRHTWYGWRHAEDARHPGRIKRLFARGHDEEDRVIGWLRAVGYKVTNTGDDQICVEDGHIKGHIDGLLPEHNAILEVKSSNLAQFKQYITKRPKFEYHGVHDLVSEDEIQASRTLQRAPEHWIQAQIYMGLSLVHNCLYIRTCKDNDYIATDWIEFHWDAFKRIMDYAKQLSAASVAPMPECDPNTFYKCNMCHYKQICMKERPAQNVHCRTCSHATPTNEDWRCSLHPKNPIPESFQLTGCKQHTLHPDMVPWHNDKRDEVFPEKVWVINGDPVRNGDGDAFTFMSKEIIEKYGSETKESVDYEQ